MSSAKTIWLVGQFKAEVEQGRIWECVGVFSTRELAITACRDSNYFVAPMVMDEQAPHETVEFEEFEYPVAAK